MTKEYLKMADVFPRGADMHDISDESSSVVCNYAVHAINSHDELVADVERLRELVCRMGMYLEMSGEYPEKESDNPIRQWLYDSIRYMASTVGD